MKILFDLLPVILFFVAFKLYNIFVATAVAIITTLLLIVYSKWVLKHVDKMLMINGLIITLLGSITLLLHDKTYIMWKPTVIYWIGAIALICSKVFFKHNLIRHMMHKILTPPEHIWARLNWLWVGFLAFLGALNLYVAFHYSENTWVNFKLFGVTGMLFGFMILQTLVLRKYLIDPSETKQVQSKE